MRYLTLTIILLALGANVARADELNAITEPIKTAVEREPINTLDPIYRAYLTIGADKFTFLIPEKFRLGSDAEKGRVELKSTENDTTITLSFCDSASLSVDGYREILLKRYTDGKISQTFGRPVAGKSGQAFDIQWPGTSGMRRSTRTIFVSTTVGLLEINLTSSTKNFALAGQTLNGFLGSLTASVNGKLQVSRLGNTN